MYDSLNILAICIHVQGMLQHGPGGGLCRSQGFTRNQRPAAGRNRAPRRRQGDVLSAVMGVDERPPGNDFTRKLARYRRLIGDGRGESEEALALRRELNALSADDPALNRADVEIRRRKVLGGKGRSA